jgi:hypothetical protein
LKKEKQQEPMHFFARMWQRKQIINEAIRKEDNSILEKNGISLRFNFDDESKDADIHS